ncbi:MAG: cytochrome c [Alphaproteobacteria bacterium]|nr:cytochrome c [Alphaproteobacteria bacterium]
MEDKLRKLIRIAILTAATMGLAGIALAQSSLLDTRSAKMKELGANMGILSAMAKGERPYDAAVAGNSAQIVANNSKIILSLFPANSTGPRTKPEIWAEWAKFEAAAKAFEAEAGKFVPISAQGKDQMAGGLTNVGKTCGGCHTPFRTEQK